MRVLVTGGAGFVGSHIAEHLVSHGHEVHIIDNLTTGVRENVPAGAHLLYDGECGLKDVASYMKRTLQYDAVVHAAAYADISANWTDASERARIWDTNLMGTMALMEHLAASQEHLKKVVFLSTAAVYGDSRGHAFNESDLPAPSSPYAASKLAGEALVQNFCDQHQWGCHILRLASVVGARYHHGHIADFVYMHRQMAVIQARDSGTQWKSYVHARDVAETVAYMMTDRYPQGVLNVASNETWSIRQTIDCMRETRWVEATFAQVARGWPGDPLNLVIRDRLLDGNGGLLHRRPIADGVRDALATLGWTS